MSMLSIAAEHRKYGWCGTSKEKSRHQCTLQTGPQHRAAAGPHVVRTQLLCGQQRHAGTVPTLHSGRTEAARKRKALPSFPSWNSCWGPPLTLPFPHSITVAASEKPGNVKGLNTASVTAFPRFARFSTDVGVSDSSPFPERKGGRLWSC